MIDKDPKPWKVRDARKQLGLSLAGLARLLGRDPVKLPHVTKSLARWESEKLKVPMPIPYETWLLLQVLVKHEGARKDVGLDGLLRHRANRWDDGGDE